MSDDLIRRSDAIKAFCMDCKGQSTPCEHSGTCKTLKVLRNRKKIPAAEPKQGEWVKHDIASYRCSECGKIQIADDINELNYCCCCGSRNKIKGADDD